MRRADNLTTFVCRLSWNLGVSTSWDPQGLSRPVMGLLYLYLYLNEKLTTWNCCSWMCRLPLFKPRVLGAFAKLRKASISVCPSVWWLGTPRLPLDGFLWNLMLRMFRNSVEKSFVKTWQAHYMKTNIQFWSHLAHLCLEWVIYFRQKMKRKSKRTFYGQ